MMHKNLFLFSFVVLWTEDYPIKYLYIWILAQFFSKVCVADVFSV